MKNKTIYWLGAIAVAYLIYRWWSNKQKTALMPLPSDNNSDTVVAEDVILDEDAPSTDARMRY